MEKKETEKPTEKKEFRGIVRIADRDVKGEKVLTKALTEIKGININLSEAVAEVASKELNIDKREKIGNLSDDQIKKLVEILENPTKFGIPAWMVNRKKDVETGKNIHLISSDLVFQQKQDIKSKIDIKSYQGVRHMFGLPVHGQRTKTMGRKGLTVGVTRKKQKPTKTKKGGAKKTGAKKKK